MEVCRCPVTSFYLAALPLLALGVWSAACLTVVVIAPDKAAEIIASMGSHFPMRKRWWRKP